MSEPGSAPRSSGVTSRRRLLAVGDQLVWSSANALTLLAAARLLTAREFGQVAAAVLIVLVVVVFARAVVTEPLLLDIADPRRLDRPGGDGRAPVLGAAVALAPVLSLAALTLPAFAPGAGPALVAAAWAAAALTVVQDATRHVAIADGRPGIALAGDAVWLVVAIAFVAYSTTNDETAAWVAVGVWAAGAASGALVALVALGRRPRLGPGRRWLARTRAAARPLALDALVGVGSANLALLLVGRVAGAEVLAGLRGAHLVLGPMNSVTDGVYLAVVPVLARRTSAGASIRRRIVQLALVLAGAWAAYGAFVLLLPVGVLDGLLGATQPEASAALPPLVLASLVGAFAIAAFYGVRAWRRVDALARIRLWLVPAYLIVLPVAAWLGAARGYGIGLAAVAAAQLVLYGMTFRRADDAGAPSDR